MLQPPVAPNGHWYLDADQEQVFANYGIRLIMVHLSTVSDTERTPDSKGRLVKVKVEIQVTASADADAETRGLERARLWRVGRVDGETVLSRRAMRCLDAKRPNLGP